MKQYPKTVRLVVTAFILAGFLALPYGLNMLAPSPATGGAEFDYKVRLLIEGELLKHGLIDPIEDEVYD